MTALATALACFLCLLIGIILSATAICAFLLYRAATTIREENHQLQQHLATLITSLTSSLTSLRADVSSSLSSLDASSLREASIQIQRSGKNLASTTAMLYKLVLSQDGAGAMIDEAVAADVDPTTGMAYVDDALPEAKAYLAHLRAMKQQVAAQQQPEDRPLPDLQEGYDADEKDGFVERY